MDGQLFDSPCSWSGGVSSFILVLWFSIGFASLIRFSGRIKEKESEREREREREREGEKHREGEKERGRERQTERGYIGSSRGTPDPTAGSFGA